MDRFLRQLITEWRRLDLPVKDAAVVVAVSGGADSVSLMLALAALEKKKKLGLEVITAHFNHALRGKESDKDEVFVRKLSEKLGLKFESGKWAKKFVKAKKPDKPDKDIKNKENLEQSAREARYEFLARIAEKYGAGAVLTGHTMDDQAETFLLRLIRGSGLDGLGAMKAVRQLKQGKNTLLARPLLNWARRADTEGFCRAEKIKYRNDPMNRDTAFLRVRVRREVLPLLQSINPQIVANLAKMSGVLQEEAEGLDITARAYLAAAAGVSNDTISVKQLAELSPGARKRVLRLWLELLRGDLRRLDMKHFAALERLVSSGTGGKRIELPGGESVSLSQGRLIFKKTKVEKSRADN